MHEHSDEDSTFASLHNDNKTELNGLKTSNGPSSPTEDNSSQESSTDSSQTEPVVYAICDGELDRRSPRGENNPVTRGVILSLLRDENIHRDHYVSSSHNRDESAFHVARFTSRHISLYPNKNRWWHKGRVTYGSNIRNMTEEVVLKSFIPVYEAIEDKACAICLDDLISDLISLNGCLHVYHKDCFLDYAIKVKKSKIVCPLCNIVSLSGTGPSPPGEMSWRVKKDMTLLSNGTFVTVIEIKYKMKSGTQTRWHPRPGKPYKGVFKKAFLPITSDYLMILKMLILAFLDGQTFKIEDSLGENVGTTVWNDIEHKTNIDGGVEKGGFPDTTYKSRVLGNILSKGIMLSNVN